MSAATEIAEREAAEAEAEHPDSEEAAEAADAEQEPEPEPEPEDHGPSERDLAKMGEKVDNEDTRHQRRLAEILGADFEHYKECPLCQVAGWVLPYPPGAVEPLQRAAIMAALGDPPAAELKFAPEAAMCPVCDGHGETLTHSKNSLHMTKVCDPCMGKGWMNKLELTTWTTQQGERERTAHLLANGPTLVPPVGGVAAEKYPDHAVPFIPAPGQADQWGRPAGHPMWGSPNRADGSAI